MEEQYSSALKHKDKEFAALESSYKELKDKYTELFSSYKLLQDDKSKIADVLIGAENTAKGIIEQAKADAEGEKSKIEEQAESLREIVVDRNRIVRDMTESVNTMVADFEKKIRNITDEISAKLSESLDSMNKSAEKIASKSSAVCENNESEEKMGLNE